MKPSSGSSENLDPAIRIPELVLPEDSSFRSFPALLSMDEFIKRNRQLREMFPNGLRMAEERWAAKTAEIFKF